MFLLLLSIIFCGFGISALLMFFQVGGIPLRSGYIIYGWPAFTVAILHLILGLTAFIFFIKQRRNKQLFQTGELQVFVRRKNKKLGAIQSLDLEFNDKALVVFYCSATRVASGLLDDFVEGQKILIRIKNQNGRDCELLGDSAYAHGMIMRK